MERSEILKELNNIFVDVLDNEDIVLTETTTANDIEEWDSLSNIQLIVAVEKHFKVRFSSEEIRNWKNVGELCDAIAGKIG
jgi:acyl carrier protein